MNRTKSVLLAAGFVLAMAFTLNGCSSDDGNNSNTLSGDNCNGETYNKYQFCANGVVYDFCDGSTYNPSIVACCNNKQYTISTQFCSGIIIYTKCGGKDYDPNTKFCLNDEIYSKCGGSSYNPSTQFCRENNVFNKCNGEEYDSNQRCIGNIIETQCGAGWYNPSTQFCKENNVFNKCNGEEYDLNQRCGTGNIIETKCGTGWFNPITDFCQNSSGSGVVKPLCGSETYTSNQRCGTDDYVEAQCGTDWYRLSSYFCLNNEIYYRCGGNEYAPSTQFCWGRIIYTLCGGKDYNPNTEFCSNNEIGNKIQCGTGWYNPVTENCYDGISGSVTYGGKTYKYVGIGTQIWMAENLDYDVPNNDTDKCYDNDPANCAKYGRLYNWATALTACPKGWHLPSDAEWTVLIDYAGGGAKLMATSGWESSWCSNGTDDYGFSALPGGLGYGYSDFVGIVGYWWSSSEIAASYLSCMNYSGRHDDSLFSAVFRTERIVLA
ncbi:MAG: hypothetical protein FWC15_07675 [Fibromonadales bacterium]|nr:hypothetical protein [Fibromonadales bacterium]